AVAFGTSAGDRVSGTDAIIALGTSGGYFLTSTTGTPTSAITLTTLTQSVGSTLSVNDMGIICNSTDASPLISSAVTVPYILWVNVYKFVSAIIIPTVLFMGTSNN
ncbi:hypothetical protein TI05_17415, partial [Achromatium sp. WMS3]